MFFISIRFLSRLLWSFLWIDIEPFCCSLLLSFYIKEDHVRKEKYHVCSFSFAYKLFHDVFLLKLNNFLLVNEYVRVNSTVPKHVDSIKTKTKSIVLPEIQQFVLNASRRLDSKECSTLLEALPRDAHVRRHHACIWSFPEGKTINEKREEKQNGNSLLSREVDTVWCVESVLKDTNPMEVDDREIVEFSKPNILCLFRSKI